MNKKIENISFRKAEIEDIPVLCELLWELFSQEVEFTPNKETQEKALKKIIEDKNIGDIFVAVKENKVIAMVNVLYTISTALGEKVAILEDMVVSQNYKNQKIGSSLIEFTLDYLKKNSFKRVTLLTDSDNFNAHNFYKKHELNLSLFHSPYLLFLLFSSSSFKYLPVYELLFSATSSGLPHAITLPPPAPPSGPRSIR